jgi:hypothetical protein
MIGWKFCRVLEVKLWELQFLKIPVLEVGVLQF